MVDSDTECSVVEIVEDSSDALWSRAAAGAHAECAPSESFHQTATSGRNLRTRSTVEGLNVCPSCGRLLTMMTGAAANAHIDSCLPEFRPHNARRYARGKRPRDSTHIPASKEFDHVTAVVRGIEASMLPAEGSSEPSGRKKGGRKKAEGVGSIAREIALFYGFTPPDDANCNTSHVSSAAKNSMILERIVGLPRAPLIPHEDGRKLAVAPLSRTGNASVSTSDTFDTTVVADNTNNRVIGTTEVRNSPLYSELDTERGMFFDTDSAFFPLSFRFIATKISTKTAKTAPISCIGAYPGTPEAYMVQGSGERVLQCISQPVSAGKQRVWCDAEKRFYTSALLPKTHIHHVLQAFTYALDTGSFPLRPLQTAVKPGPTSAGGSFVKEACTRGVDSLISYNSTPSTSQLASPPSAVDVAVSIWWYLAATRSQQWSAMSISPASLHRCAAYMYGGMPKEALQSGGKSLQSTNSLRSLVLEAYYKTASSPDTYFTSKDAVVRESCPGPATVPLRSALADGALTSSKDIQDATAGIRVMLNAIDGLDCSVGSVVVAIRAHTTQGDILPSDDELGDFIFACVAVYLFICLHWSEPVFG